MLENKKVLENFPGNVVRKDLTTLIKEGQNVPIYVLEYLLGMYASTDDEEQIQSGVEHVKRILAENYVKPDEAEKVKYAIKKNGTFSIIDRVTVKFDEKKNANIATFASLGINNVRISDKYVDQYQKLLQGGIRCMLQMTYLFDEEDRHFSPFIIENLKPIQIPNVDLSEIKNARKNFTKEERIDLLLRSVGMEPSKFKNNEKRHLLERMVPFVESNYNLCELGPRSTGKSHMYKEISPNSILISGGQTTVANLFYNMASRTVGLVGLRDVVAFDEVAGINFKDKDGVQIMKDYMNSGSFARGKDPISGEASLVFVGNINQDVKIVQRTSHLFSPFPDVMNGDTAFFDRMHYYLPGWEIPKLKREHFTKEYGFIVDYLAEFFRGMRKETFADIIDHYFSLGSSFNQRDSTAVRKTFSGLMKLIYPDGNFNKEDAAEVLEYAMQGRRRVKEQLKKMGGMEFYETQFSYTDKETSEQHYVSLAEMGGGKLIPEGTPNPGHLYFIAISDQGKKGVYKIETQMTSGTGHFTSTGLGSCSNAKESFKTVTDYFKANAKDVSANISIKDKEYHIALSDLQGIGTANDITLPTYVALCGMALEKSVQDQLAIIGCFSLGGTVKRIDNLADILQVAADAGAKKVLIPSASAGNLGTVPSDLLSKFQIIFYDDPRDAVYKAVGLN